LSIFKNEQFVRTSAEKMVASVREIVGKSTTLFHAACCYTSGTHRMKSERQQHVVGDAYSAAARLTSNN
jgi:hypothetical protein